MARDWRYYVPPNLRGPLSEAGRVGYQLLDNLIGYDDEFDTAGELLARSLREDPRGTLGSMAGGLAEGVRTAVTQPVQTARDAADEFANAFLRLREPLPEDATREDLGQRLGDLSLLGSLVPGGALARRAVPSRRPDVPEDPWENLDFDNLPDDISFTPDNLPETTLAEELMAPDYEAENLADAQAALRAEQELERQLARRDAFIAALGGEEAYNRAMRGYLDMDPADLNEAAENFSNFPVLEREVFSHEDNDYTTNYYSAGLLAAMRPDAVRELAAQIGNDPRGRVHSPELVEMLADMTQQELAEITGLPIQPIAGGWTGNLPTPPAEIDFDIDLDGPQPTDAQIAQFQAEQAAEQAAYAATFDWPNPWINVEGAEDMAAAYADDPFRGISGSRALAGTAPASGFLDANPYLPTPERSFQQPQSWLSQGIAGIYPRSARAAEQLRQPRYSDLAGLRNELEGRGAAKKELDRQLPGLEARMNERGSLSREEIRDFFDSGTDALQIRRTLKFAEGYMPPGGQNNTSTVYYHPAVTQGPKAAERHFSSVGAFDGSPQVPLFHSRSAQYDLQFPGGGRTHHVAEIQSDFGQFRQTLPRNPEERAEMEARVEELRVIPESSFGDEERLEFLRLLKALEYGGYRDDFDMQYGDTPFINRENDWVDAALRQNIVDAVNSGSDWITFGNGPQANRHIKMPLEAAKSFYDTRVPRRIEDVLRRFSNQTGTEAPQLERIPFVDGEDVLGFRITPEFREALIQNGLPSFKNGGIVSLLHN